MFDHCTSQPKELATKMKRSNFIALLLVGIIVAASSDVYKLYFYSFSGSVTQVSNIV